MTKPMFPGLQCSEIAEPGHQSKFARPLLVLGLNCYLRVEVLKWAFQPSSIQQYRSLQSHPAIDYKAGIECPLVPRAVLQYVGNNTLTAGVT